MTAVDASVLSMFEGRVRANPRAPAVVDDGRICSYSELAEWVGTIEAQLAAAGTVRGMAVGVRMRRGTAWVAAVLALLRAGAIYVPLHPGLPAARQREMCVIAGVGLVLADAVSDAGEATLLVPAERPAATASIGVAMPPHPQAPAYVIFTSGTSGRPKAVGITHGNLASHAQLAIARYALTAEDRVLQTCAIGFDISLEEVIPTLCVGACLVIAPDHAGQYQGGLGALVGAQSVTVANLPTALWSAWVEELTATPRALPSLRCLIVGGEACPVASVRAWLDLDLASRVDCINAYGPTETTITTTAWTMRALPDEQLHAPIGRALSGIAAYVFDEDLLPAASGELHLGGTLVGAGYQGQPAATAAVFLPDPYTGVPGARMYRSGDQVQLDNDGELVLIGRLDRQIKLRGHRIEPAEIERRLEASGQFRAVAVALSTQGEAETLVAYVVPRACREGNARFIRADAPELAQCMAAVDELPDYMRPRWYCLLHMLPLNSNGKTDLHALPSLPATGGLSASPGDEFLACVQQILGYLPPDLAHSFHAAGGDSIQAVQLLALLRQRGWQLEAQALVSMPLHALGAVLHPHTAAPLLTSEDNCAGVSLDAGERQRLREGTPRWTEVDQVCATTRVQLGMLYRSLTVKRAGQYIEQVEGMLDDLDVPAFQAAWRSVVAEHAILRASFSLVLRDKPLLLVHRTVEPEWQMSVWPDDASGLQQRISSSLADDRARGFDLLSPPLLRFQLAQAGPRRHHFIWTYHHALLDGWSDIAVLDTVFDHYNALLAQAPPPPVPKATFTDYVIWLQAQDRSAARAYWQDHLAGLPMRRPWLLVDPALPASGRMERREHRFDPDRTAALAGHARAAGATLNTLLLAAWGRTIGEVRQTPDVVLGTVVATRPPALCDRIVGPLLNVLPLRQHRGRIGDSSLAALQRLQAERLPHVHIALDDIAAADAPPLFDTLFVFENYPPSRHRATARLRSHTQTEYPLSLLIWPDQGLRIEMLYDPALIDAALLDSLCIVLDRVLGEMLARAEMADQAPTGADDTCMELVI